VSFELASTWWAHVLYTTRAAAQAQQSLQTRGKGELCTSAWAPLRAGLGCALKSEAGKAPASVCLRCRQKRTTCHTCALARLLSPLLRCG